MRNRYVKIFGGFGYETELFIAWLLGWDCNLFAHDYAYMAACKGNQKGFRGPFQVEGYFWIRRKPLHEIMAAPSMYDGDANAETLELM